MPPDGRSWRDPIHGVTRSVSSIPGLVCIKHVSGTVGRLLESEKRAECGSSIRALADLSQEGPFS